MLPDPYPALVQYLNIFRYNKIYSAKDICYIFDFTVQRETSQDFASDKWWQQE